MTRAAVYAVHPNSNGPTMLSDRKLALAAGVLYLVTFVTSIPALALKTAFLADVGPAAPAQLAAVLEIALAFACVGTAVVLLPIIRGRSPILSAGFVASRVVEAGLILVGVLALLSLVTVRAAETRDDGSETLLVALHDWAFLLGPAVMASVNALLLGTALYRARLVPRVIPAIGLAGAPLLLASSVGVMFGAWTQVSLIGALSAVPIAVWELSLGLWLVVRGVRAGVGASAPE